ncbi:hypothetical protein C8Q69DRAFT_139821 [Paecilomyces variotii]|uniref:Uncharacterized protein n=1 Tax=Byssochlamys spectabilis TaxID=264951 RepID=A0A443I0E3_BYSSP|nr:hypothetical protein C8Q69DRAFT_139821 [Paecilomyces variotii]RWQ97533.1 hypothetical protein C8Q69DRAFT_139821 [Paecilomyces variotii]
MAVVNYLSYLGSYEVVIRQTVDLCALQAADPIGRGWRGARAPTRAPARSGERVTCHKVPPSSWQDRPGEGAPWLWPVRRSLLPGSGRSLCLPSLSLAGCSVLRISSPPPSLSLCVSFLSLSRAVSLSLSTYGRLTYCLLSFLFAFQGYCLRILSVLWYLLSLTRTT